MRIHIQTITRFFTPALVFTGLLYAAHNKDVINTHQIKPIQLSAVKITDGFWSPKLKVWYSKTIYDVLDKLEVYALEGIDNAGIDAFHLTGNSILIPQYKSDIANGVNVISGKMTDNLKEVNFTAIPFYAIGNRGIYSYKVWLDK